MLRRTIAIPTQHEGGITDIVSNVFGRARTFTILHIKENEIQTVDILPNPAIEYQHGAGPVVAKMLMDTGVNTVIASEFGPGVSVLLEHFNVKQVTTSPGINVATAIQRFLTSTNSEDE
jgi:predicted Fe-Mo cluster-binding NifX family protein